MADNGVAERTFDPHGEIAYCMGLIVGEGSFTGTPTVLALSVRLHVSDPLPLLDLQRVFGGTIYGLYSHGGRNYRMWLLRGSDLLDALPYFDRWLPPSRKREQFLTWRSRHAAYFEHLGWFHVLRSWDALADT